MDEVRRFLLLRYPLFVALLSSFLVAASVQGAPTKVAVLLPSTNTFKDLGNNAKQGFLLGIKEEVTTQQVPWDSWIKLEFFDTRVDAAYSLQVAKDAIANGAKAILGPAVSSAVTLKLRDYVLVETSRLRLR